MALPKSYGIGLSWPLGPGQGVVLAPTLTVAPAVTGTAQVGQVLSCSTGTWANNPTSYAYQWYWADTNAAVAGATSAPYTAVSGDVGHTLRCQVTASNSGGSLSAFSNTTSAVASNVTAPAAPAISVASVGDGTITLNWTDGATNGAAIDARYISIGTASGGEGSLIPVTVTAGQVTLTGLTNSQIYYIEGWAHNTAGMSAPSGEVSGTPTAGGSSLNALTLDYTSKEVYEYSPAGTKLATIRDTSGGALSIVAVEDNNKNSLSTASSGLFAISGGDIVCGATSFVWAGAGTWARAKVRESKVPFADVDTWLYFNILPLSKAGTPFTDSFTQPNTTSLRTLTGWGIVDAINANSELIAIYSNGVAFISPGTTNPFSVAYDAVSPNVSVEFTLGGGTAGTSAAGVAFPSVFLRYGGRTTNYIQVQLAATGNLSIAKRGGGTQNSMGSVTGSSRPGGFFKYGDKIRCDVINNQAYLYVTPYGGSVAQVGTIGGYSVSDVLTTSARVGFATWSGGTANSQTIDDISITPLATFGIDAVVRPVFYADVASGFGAVRISGTLPTAGAPTTFEWRLETDAGVLVAGYDWTSFTPLVHSGTGVPTWQYNFSVPMPTSITNYQIKVRDAAATTNVLTSTAFGVGDIVIGYGQSNMANMRDYTTSAPVTDNYVNKAWKLGYPGSSAVGAQALQAYAKMGGSLPQTGMTNTLIAATNRPAVVINYAHGAQSANGLSPDVSTVASGNDWFGMLRDAIIRNGCNVSCVIINQGEQDTSTANSVYASLWDTTCQAILNISGRRAGSLPFYMSYVKGYTATANQGSSSICPGYINIRSSILLWSTLRSYYYLSHHPYDTDYQFGETIHISADHYFSKMGPRFMRTHMRIGLGMSSVPSQMGPFASSISRPNTSTVRLNVNLNGADSIAADGGLTAPDGFQVVVGSTFASKFPSGLNPVTGVTVGTNYIDLALTTPVPTGTQVCVRYPASVSSPAGGGTAVFDGAEMFGQAYVDGVTGISGGGQTAAPQVRGSYSSGAYTIGLAPVVPELAS